MGLSDSKVPFPVLKHGAAIFPARDGMWAEAAPSSPAPPGTMKREAKVEHACHGRDVSTPVCKFVASVSDPFSSLSPIIVPGGAGGAE